MAIVVIDTITVDGLDWTYYSDRVWRATLYGRVIELRVTDDAGWVAQSDGKRLVLGNRSRCAAQVISQAYFGLIFGAAQRMSSLYDRRSGHVTLHIDD